LAHVGLIERARIDRTVELAWPRIVTGLARMSKNAVDVAMVGIAIGPAAIAGVGFASPFWMLSFSVGGGIAGGTIALVSQRYGAETYDELGQAVRTSVLLVMALTIPIGAIFWLFPSMLIGLLTDDAAAMRLGSAYLRNLGLGFPFAALNLVWSRVLIGADDAWTPMVFRVGGALVNVLLNAILIFALDMGVVGAALGTIIANATVAITLAFGLITGHVPGVGTFPVTITALGQYADRSTIRDLAKIGIPVIGRNGVETVARFPMLAIVGLYGQPVVAAYVISRRIWDLMNTPGWGFRLAVGSLVGQALGAGDEETAEAFGRELTRFSVAVYLVPAVLVALFAEPIVRLFVTDPVRGTIPVGVTLVYAACIAVVPSGITTAMAGALTAAGDTRWPFYGKFTGAFVVAIPLAYLGATTGVGITGLVFAYIGWTLCPAIVNCYRYSTDAWREISRTYRPDAAVTGD
jgi:putative MATE family efflux protein